MKLTFIGAAHEVTGSCTLLNANGKNILIDCGMEQGGDTYENCSLPVVPGEIDAVLLTHAHIDHSGMIPALVKDGYSGPVYSTKATKMLCDIMLRDSAYIAEQEAQWRNRKAKRAGREPFEPVYTINDAEAAVRLFKEYGYNEKINIFKGIDIEFIDAGHLLGSSSIYVRINENEEKRTVLFSGDIGNTDRPLIKNPKKPEEADYVVIESTYGDRLHGERPDYITQLTDVLTQTFNKGGNLVIPSFAVGRTQELLYLFRKIKEEKLIKGFEDFSVYIDSPLAIEATKIYESNLFDYYDEETLELLHKGINPISFKGLKLSITKEDSMKINYDTSPKVIISASGMCEAGRIRHHLKHNLWEEKNTILFVGYQAEGTLGRRLINGAESVTLFGEEIKVRAKIEFMSGISGHADKNMLTDWLDSIRKKPVRVFVNHGNDFVCESFAAYIQDKLGIPSAAPFSGDVYDLSDGECIEKGRVVRVSDISEGRKRANAAFDRLLSSVERLKNIAVLSKVLSNKEIAKFTDQINDLCNKYRMKTKR